MLRPALVLCLIAPIALADEVRQLGAHEHGVGQLNIAIEGDEVALTLTAPGADIVGFEYPPTTADERAAVAMGFAKLGAPLSAVEVPEAAGCVVHGVAVSLAFEGDEDHGDHDHGADEHGHEDHGDHDHGHDDHGHDEKAEEDHADHGHDEHGHDEHGQDEAAEASHSEFRMTATYECAAPEALTTLSFPYFTLFPNAQELEVQAVGPAGALGAEVTRDAPTLNLDGAL